MSYRRKAPPPLPSPRKYEKIVRVVTGAEEHRVVMFCEESGTVERVTVLHRFKDDRKNAFFIQFQKLASVAKCKLLAKSAKLGGYPVQVDSVAGSPLLQEQYKQLCQVASPKAQYAASPLKRRRFSSATNRENRGLGLIRRLSAPSSVLCDPCATLRAIRTPTSLSNKDNTGYSTSLGRMSAPPMFQESPHAGNRAWRANTPSIRQLNHPDLRQAVTSKTVNFRLRALSTATTTSVSTQKLPSPLARSTSLLRQSARVADVFHPVRSQSASPPVSHAWSSSSVRRHSVLAGIAENKPGPILKNSSAMRQDVMNAARSVRSSSASPSVSRSWSIPVTMHQSIFSERTPSFIDNGNDTSVIYSSPEILPSGTIAAVASASPSSLTRMDVIKEELASAKKRYAKTVEKIHKHYALVDWKYERRGTPRNSLGGTPLSAKGPPASYQAQRSS
ncbi:uncharacterized protein FOMMEDRAFT_156685 [Fomitiporia mediterranea MF3/22]|uniref:uncharacterized protein n=1 Tax=Fomitiporia mediterranea (strain MF3/22) TaxID=694068 RepID=UPI0004408378|nr:uncharacterized protein FOMMEDRAFT_156685 [Fomitiporia mediterranea MF3/22]EJD03299.1 hypothetical protein FOMMEDRAFT_156685 [Fomitiporia mediterranea MF3/22]